MKIWIHEGNGHWIGSVVCCMAETEEEASPLIREFLDQSGLKNEPLNLRWHRADIPGVFYSDDGDY